MNKDMLNFFVTFLVVTWLGVNGQAQVCNPQTVKTLDIPEWNRSHFVPNNFPAFAPFEAFAVPNSLELKMLTPDLVCHEQGRLRSREPVQVCYDQVQGDIQDTFTNGFCFKPQSIYIYSQNIGTSTTAPSITVPSMKMYLDAQKALQQSELFLQVSLTQAGWEGGLFGSQNCIQYRYQIPACK
ncbi:MAG: hypothetical protein ACK5WZ_01405 [Pseudobdellovibrionaceae bacterium]